MAEFDSVIPAGESGTLTAKIKTTTTQSGSVSKSISVTTDAPGVERLTLSVTFKTVTAVSVLPRPRISLNGVEGDESTQTLILRRADGETLEIKGVDIDDQRLVITTEVVNEKTAVGNRTAMAGDVLVRASVGPEVQAVSTNGRFRIRTNHPDALVIDVVYAIRLRPVIEARPAELRLLLQEGNNVGRTMLFRVHHNRRGEFKLTGAKASNPELFSAQLIDGEIKQETHNIAVRLQDDVLPGTIQSRLMESLVITTDDSANPEITIPVLIEPRALRKPSRPRPLE